MSLSDRLKSFLTPQEDKFDYTDLNPAKITTGFAGDIAQGMARTVGTVGITSSRALEDVANEVASRFFGKTIEHTFQEEIQTKGNKVTEFVFGGEPIRDLRGYGQQGLNLTEKLTGKKVSSSLAIPLGVLGVGADLTGMGGPLKRGGLNLMKEELDVILKSKSKDVIKNTLLKSGKVVEEDADALANVLKHVSTEKEFTNVTKQLIDRGFIKSVKKIAPNAERVAGQYIARDTDELAIKARNLIIDNQEMAENAVLKASNAKGLVDEDIVALGTELVKKYSDDAAKAMAKGDESLANTLYDKMAEVVNPLAIKLTDLGRAVQAASILGRATPEGQLRFAAKTIQKWNIANPTKQIPGLTANDIKFITEKMREAQALPDGMEKGKAMKEINDFVQSKIPTPEWKKWTTVWKAGLLTGVKTSGLNVASTGAHGITEIAKDIPAAIVDSIASLFTGKRTKTFTTRGTASGTVEGLKKGWTYWKTGFDERNVAEKLDMHKVNFGKGVVAEAFQKYTDTVFRTIGAEDQPFYYGAAARSIADQAMATAKNTGLKGKAARDYAEELMKEPTEQMIENSVLDATTAVFQNETWLGEKATSISKALGPVGEIVIPFKRTPASVAMQVLNYSPVGIVRAVVENFSVQKNIIDDIPTELKGIFAEAKKYKSAEEFVKAQGASVFRGGEPIDLTKGSGLGISVSTDRTVAQRFGKGKIVDELNISPRAKVFDASSATPSLIKNDLNEQNILEYARENGYDAVDFTKSLVSNPKLKGTYLPEDEIRVLNPDVLKTKSQLTDIWKKAQKPQKTKTTVGLDQRQFSTMMGRGITGTVPMYIGYELFNNDMVTLGYPESDREKALYEAEGRKDNSIKINGKWRDPVVLGPAGNLIIAGANFAKGVKDTGSVVGGMAQAMVGTVTSLKEQTFLSGINTFIQAANKPGQYLQSYIQGLAASTIPTIVSDVAKAIDPLERRISSDEEDWVLNSGEKVLEAVMNRIPFAREQLEPKIDALGRKIESKGNPAEIMIDPSRPNSSTDTPVTRELRRLTEKGYGVAPTKLGEKEGYSILSPEQNTQLWIDAGELVNRKLTKLMNGEKYRAASDEERGKAVVLFIEKAKNEARALLVIELTDGLAGRPLAEMKKKLRAAKLLTTDVELRVLELR